MTTRIIAKSQPELMYTMHVSASQLTDPSIYITEIQYSQFIGGFAAVLSDGKAAFITASSPKFEPSVSSHRYNIVIIVLFYIMH